MGSRTRRDWTWDLFREQLRPTDRGCLEWQRTRNYAGYGRVRDGAKWAMAHRVAFRLSSGPIPKGAIICHHCDNPPCCNPEHLYAGTHQSNARDAQRRERHRKSAWGLRLPDLIDVVSLAPFADHVELARDYRITVGAVRLAAGTLRERLSDPDLLSDD